MGLLQPRSALDADPEFRLAPTQLPWPADVPRHKHYHDEPRDPWGKWTDDPDFINAPAAGGKGSGAGTDQLKTGTGGGMGGAKGAAPGIPTARTFRTVSDSDWEAMKDADHDWSQAQRASVSAYTDASFMPVNSYLRKGKIENWLGYGPGGNVASVNEEIANLDAAMEPLEEDTMVYRGMSFRGLPDGWADADPADLIGQTMQDKGYVSTSVDSKAEITSNEVRLEVEVPKGHKQLVPGSLSAYQNEREMVLARGTRMIVTDARRDSGGNLLLKVRAGT